MAKLVEDADVYAYLDIVAEEDDPSGIALKIRDAAESLLEEQCLGQSFGPSATVTDETLDGTGQHIIFTRRPISAVSAIKFRYLPEVVQESYYNVDLTNGITFRVGKRRIYSRILAFPEGRDNVLITYDTQDNRPTIAIQAVNEAISAVYLNRGSEGVRSEQLGSFQHQLIRSFDELKFWNKAVESLQIPYLG